MIFTRITIRVPWIAPNAYHVTTLFGLWWFWAQVLYRVDGFIYGSCKLGVTMFLTGTLCVGSVRTHSISSGSCMSRLWLKLLFCSSLGSSSIRDSDSPTCSARAGTWLCCVPVEWSRWSACRSEGTAEGGPDRRTSPAGWECRTCCPHI